MKINEITLKILEVLKEDKRIKSSILSSDDNYCYIKIENTNNSNESCIIIENNIFIQVDDEEYYPLDEWEIATRKLIKGLDETVEISISYTDENNDIIEYGFYSKKGNIEFLINKALEKLKNEFSFMKNINKMSINNFYGDFQFDAEWNGKTFVPKEMKKR